MSGIFITPQVITGSGSAPIGTAGGELSGTYPNPNVVIINGATVPDSGSALVGNTLQISSSDTLSYGSVNLAGGSNFVNGILPVINLPSATTGNEGIIKLSGDLAGSATNPSVISINGSTVPASGSLITGHILQVNGSSSLAYSALNLAGGTNFVSGLLPAINQSPQILSGDLSGTTDLATVTRLQGKDIATTLPTSNYSLIWDGNEWSPSLVSLTAGVTGILPIGNQAPQSLSGDLSGTTSSATVIRLQGQNVSSTAPTTNYSFIWNGSSWTPSLVSLSAGVTGILPVANQANQIIRLTQNISTSDLQALGAISTGTINIGSSLPANARLLGAEINTTQILAGIGLSIALATVQGGNDLAGSIITGVSILTTGYVGMNGTNQYLTRGGQQLTITIVLTGAVFSAITAGSLVVNIFYTVVS